MIQVKKDFSYYNFCKNYEELQQRLYFLPKIYFQ